jgi:predicted transposase YbfD/YdcC
MQRWMPGRKSLSLWQVLQGTQYPWPPGAAVSTLVGIARSDLVGASMTPERMDRLAERLDQEPAHSVLPLVAADNELSLLHHFARLTDPRTTHTCLHHLTDVVVIALCAVLGGANSWDDIALFGQSFLDWFARFLDLPNGIPSHDTFNRVFAALNPVAFQECFVSWMNAVCGRLGLKRLQIDGKSLRGSRGRKNQLGCLHTVSLWAAETGLTLGQVAVADKSNEITAIPQLLQLLDLEGALVTIDAMGCQKEIAERIRLSNGHYVLAVKENQPKLYADIRACFSKAFETEFEGLRYEELEEQPEQKHGRREKRAYTVIYEPQGLSTAGEWKDLKAIIMVYRERQLNTAIDDKGYSEEVSYYIASSVEPVEELAGGIRAHWGIENKVHWVLDVVFREDDSRVRAGHAAENLGWLRRVALALLKQDDSKGSLKGKRLKAGWDNDFLEKLLGLLGENLLPDK